MSLIRYLLDEHVDALYRIQLLRREQNLTVWRIGDAGAPPVGTLDPEILIWCEEHDFILITNNRKTMSDHLLDHLTTGRHSPGVFVMNPKMGIGETIEELILIWGASDASEHQDRITYLPLSY
jgi:hypothetical protein